MIAWLAALDEEAGVTAICIARGTTLATRNTTDFTGLGLDLIEPWANSG